MRLKDIALVLKRHGIIRGISPQQLRSILEDLGPTYIKLGQFMSMRPDILPRAYCDALEGLRTDVKPVPFEEIINTIEEEYGFSVDKVFSNISKEIIGSASIAQVHKATLKNGNKVVVKVQRPGIYQIMQEDIQLLKKAAGIMKIIGITGEAIDFRIILDEMWAAAQQEMNFLIEANNIEEFTKLNRDVENIYFPKVEKSLTTTKVLVLEYIEGIPINDIDNLKKMGYNINEIGMKLAENYTKQILDDGFFHADPHPGNIIIKDGKIVWLDLGMVGRLTNRDRTLLKKAVTAVVDRDIDELINILSAMGTVKGKVNYGSLYEDLDQILIRYSDIELANLNLGELLSKMFEIANCHNISTPQGLSMLGRGILTIEGVLAACSPDINFIQVITNHMSKSILFDINVLKELSTSIESLYNISKKGISLPAQISDVLKAVSRGRAKLNVDITGAGDILRHMDNIADKLVVCIIIAALLIGSSLICTTDMTPKFFGIPVLGFAGYLSAAVLGCWLIFGILSKKWRKFY
ncbi:MAG TPA: AarF/ABC1/UbiB kinase family protein [Clostridiaceae bacterium]|nr:AarF/ABC1/UbiB kinase family protein [Clostridiaceae bacterium]